MTNQEDNKTGDTAPLDLLRKQHDRGKSIRPGGHWCPETSRTKKKRNYSAVKHQAKNNKTETFVEEEKHNKKK
jgi:hypothetical protein